MVNKVYEYATLERLEDMLTTYYLTENKRGSYIGTDQSILEVLNNLGKEGWLVCSKVDDNIFLLAKEI